MGTTRFFGLLGSRQAQIGHLDSKGATAMSKLGPTRRSQ